MRADGRSAMRRPEPGRQTTMLGPCVRSAGTRAEYVGHVDGRSTCAAASAAPINATAASATGSGSRIDRRIRRLRVRTMPRERGGRMLQRRRRGGSQHGYARPMADPSLGPPGAARIFISYRRRETAGHAGRLYDRLAEHFGDERVFMDVEMEAGVDFVEQINAAVGSCGALIVLIGDEWLTVTDASGRRRVDDPTDVHRVEVEAALKRGVRVIPALVQGARMPLEEELPEALRPLGRRQAVELSDQRWDYDVNRLIAVLKPVLAAAEATAPRDRVRRGRRRLAQALVRHPWLVYGVGLATGLLIALAALAATGYFGAPLL